MSIDILRNALHDINRMDSEYQTLEMAMDIAGAALKEFAETEQPVELPEREEQRFESAWKAEELLKQAHLLLTMGPGKRDALSQLLAQRISKHLDFPPKQEGYGHGPGGSVELPALKDVPPAPIMREMVGRGELDAFVKLHEHTVLHHVGDGVYRPAELVDYLLATFDIRRRGSDV